MRLRSWFLRDYRLIHELGRVRDLVRVRDIELALDSTLSVPYSPEGF